MPTSFAWRTSLRLGIDPAEEVRIGPFFVDAGQHRLVIRVFRLDTVVINDLDLALTAFLK